MRHFLSLTLQFHVVLCLAASSPAATETDSSPSLLQQHAALIVKRTSKASPVQPQADEASEAIAVRDPLKDTLQETKQVAQLVPPAAMWGSVPIYIACSPWPPKLPEQGTTKWTVPVFLAAYAGYFAAIVAYEHANFTKDDIKAVGQGGKPREQRWDFVRFVLALCVLTNHLKDLFFDSPFPWWAHPFLDAVDGFMMSGFAFLSGVFGRSMTGSSLENMVCYTLVASLLISTLDNLLEHAFQWGFQVQPQVVILLPFLWYMPALFVWRLTISPFCQVARRYGVSFGWVFLTYAVAAYFVRHTMSSCLDSAGENIACSWRQMLNDIMCAGMFYCAGLWKTPEEWMELFSKTSATRLSLVITASWTAAYLASSHCRSAFGVYGLWGGPGDYLERLGLMGLRGSVIFEHQNHPGPISVRSVVMDTKILVLKLVVTLATVCSLVACVEPWRRLEGVLSTIVFQNGSRAVYVYLLHPVLVLRPGMHSGIPAYTKGMGPVAVGTLWLTVVLMTGFMLSSRLTEKLFGWAVMPYWVKPMWRFSPFSSLGSSCPTK